MRKWRIIVPGSSGNAGPGFDCCGLALDIVNEFVFALGDARDYQISFGGSVAIGDKYKNPRDNYVVQAYEQTCAQLKLAATPFALHCDINIPLSAGMGSSGTAHIAGVALALLRHKLQDRLDAYDADEMPPAELLRQLKPELLHITAATEGHPDNVAPSIYGGFVICATKDGAASGGADNNGATGETKSAEKSGELAGATARIITKAHPVAAKVKCLLFTPALEVATAKSRAALPSQVARRDAVFNLGHAALTAAAFAAGDYELLRESVHDRMHEAARDTLYDYHGLKCKLLSAGALAVSLSGSGPTVLALCYDGKQQGLQQAAAAHFSGRQLEHRHTYVGVNNHGTQLELL